MKTTRMVIGIISMVLFIMVSLQSCAAGVSNAIADNGEISGSAGMLLAICMLIAGIIAVAARKTKAGTVVALCFYVFGAAIGFSNAGSYGDLKIWSALSLIFAIILLITLLTKPKNDV